MLLFQLQEPYYTDLNRYSRIMRIGNVPQKIHLIAQGFAYAYIFEKTINDAYSADLNRCTPAFFGIDKPLRVLARKELQCLYTVVA